MPSEITIPAKFPGKCKACGFKFPAGEWIKFDTVARTAVHRKCPEISYNGTEQAALFNQWVKTVEQADKEAEERMNIPPSPHLSQPYEDME